jgi:acyl dehydratase
MPVPASAAGSEAGTQALVVGARQLMAYAAGIGTAGECYFDDLRPGGILGHPAFCVSLEWPVVSGAEYQAAIGRAPGAPRGATHVLQDSRFHRPIRPGDSLVTRGRIAQVRQTGAGALVTSCVETRDAASHALVVTSWTAAMFLRDTVDGDPATVDDPPPLRPDAEVTAPAARISLQTAPGLAHRYSECAAIWNPIHTERAAARAIGLPDIILHGTCTWALAGQALIDAVAGGDPRRLRRLAGRFKGMVFPGDTLTLEYGADSPGTWQFAVRTPRGDLAITHGVAEIDA